MISGFLCFLLVALLSIPSLECQQSGLFSDGQKVIIPSNLTVNGIDVLHTILSLQSQISAMQTQISQLQSFVGISYYSSSTVCPNTGIVPVVFTTKVFDTHNAFDGTIFAAPLSGFYQINTALVPLPTSSATGSITLGIGFNSTVNGFAYEEVYNVVSGGEPTVSMSYLAQLNVGDRVAVLFNQDTGAALALDPSTDTYFHIYKVSN